MTSLSAAWRIALAVTVGSAAVAALPAVAQGSPPGRLLASNCFQCHGTNGRGPGFEDIAGESPQKIYEELVEMRAGREGSGLMVKHAMGYTDEQLRLLAEWLATQR
ncbi:MAG: c-type cytochrome [Burkholderiales bacterium]|nr:c-type cytochrome [Burkholderiales bacterium]